MYTKISYGTNFMGAALYNSGGLSKAQKKQKAGKVELLYTNNLLSSHARTIALEMQKLASYSRSQKPVWNIAMSAPKGVQLTAAQWQYAAEYNLRVMGVEPERYQYAIYRHKDTELDHIHILFNSVPVDGGPAMSRQYKAAKAKLAAPALDQAVGIESSKGTGIRDQIAQALGKAMNARPTTADELKTDLLKCGVLIEYATNKTGIYGVNFQLAQIDHRPVKGSTIEIGGKKAKWNTLAALLEANRAEFQAEIERLQQEKDEAEKRREIEENARKKAEQERDEALNQPARVEIQYREREIIKEVVKPDPADKALIERLKREKEEAERLGRKNYDAAIRWKDEADALKNKNENQQGVLTHQEHTIKRLEKENEELKKQLNAKPTPAEISRRLYEYYSITGASAGGFNGRELSDRMQSQTASNLRYICAFLAKDMPAGASKIFEKRIPQDIQKNDFVPLSFVKEFRTQPPGERRIGFKPGVENDEWTNIKNNPPSTDPGLKIRLERMETPVERLDQKRGKKI